MSADASTPIVYRKSSAFFAAFPCPIRVIRPLLPHPMIVPVPLAPGVGVAIAALFDYEDTSIGPYREVGLGFMSRLRRSGPLPLLPLLAERFFEDVGPWVQLLPVTTQLANDLGRSIWGFPKFVADIRITRNTSRIEAEVIDETGPVLSLSFDRPGPATSHSFPLRLYSALGDELLFTELHADAQGSTTMLRPRATLTIHDHPRTTDLDRHALTTTRPIEVRWFDDYRTLLDRPSIRYRMSA